MLLAGISHEISGSYWILLEISVSIADSRLANGPVTLKVSHDANQ